MFYLQPSGLFSAQHPHHNSQLPPFEFLQSWTGSFAGITSSEIKALLLSLRPRKKNPQSSRGGAKVFPNPTQSQSTSKGEEKNWKQTQTNIQRNTRTNQTKGKQLICVEHRSATGSQLVETKWTALKHSVQSAGNAYVHCVKKKMQQTNEIVDNMI